MYVLYSMDVHVCMMCYGAAAAMVMVMMMMA